MHPRPKRPSGPGWAQLPSSPDAKLSDGAEPWYHPETFAIVTSEVHEADPYSGPAFEYHLSISIWHPTGVARCSDDFASRVLAEFGMSDAEEDDDGVRTVRHFWLPVDPSEYH